VAASRLTKYLLGVLISHTNMVAETVIFDELGRDYIHDHEVTHGSPFEYRTLAHLPAAHIAGVQGYFVLPFYMGGPVYWMVKFDWKSFLHYNRRYKITFFFSVPSIFLLIAKSPLVTDQFDNLEVAISGAAPLGKDLQIAASAKLGRGKTFVSQTWGLSETTGSVTAMPWGQSDNTGSVSLILPNMILRFVEVLLKPPVSVSPNL
jgi:4-coumarate--CoA ligase